MNPLRKIMHPTMKVIAISATLGSFETLVAAMRYRLLKQSAVVQSSDDAWECKVCGRFQ